MKAYNIIEIMVGRYEGMKLFLQGKFWQSYIVLYISCIVPDIKLLSFSFKSTLLCSAL